MSYQEATEHQEFARAAVNLALTAARLRDADDALVALGRSLYNTDADRQMPEHDDMVKALGAVGQVSMAYLHMREAEATYERLRESVRGPEPE